MNLVETMEEVTAACDEKYLSKETESGCVIGVSKADGKRCGRCWFSDNQVGKLGLVNTDLCQRCDAAISIWEKEKGEKFEVETPLQ